MLKVQLDLMEYMICYKCPKCETQDVHHMGTLKNCYHCGVLNEFDVGDLLNSIKERISYNKCGKTLNGWIAHAKM